MAIYLDAYDHQNPFSRGIPEKVFWDYKNIPYRPKYWEHMSAEEKDMYLKKGNLWERFKDFLSDTSDKLDGEKGVSEEFKKQADSIGMTPREYIRAVERAYPKESKNYGPLFPPVLGEGIVNPYVPKDRDPNYTGPKPNMDFERVDQAWANGPTLPHEDTVSSGVQARFLKGDNASKSLTEKLEANAYARSRTRNLERTGENIEPYARWKAHFEEYQKSRLEDFDSAYAKYRAATKHVPHELDTIYRARLDNEVSD